MKKLKISNKLEKMFIYDAQNPRAVDSSDDSHVYAVDFHGKPQETIIQFLTRLSQNLSKMQNKFTLIGACLEFDEPFAVVEFSEDDNESKIWS